MRCGNMHSLVFVFRSRRSRSKLHSVASTPSSARAAFPKLRVGTQNRSWTHFYLVAIWQNKVQNNTDIKIYSPDSNRERFLFCFVCFHEFVKCVHMKAINKFSEVVRNLSLLSDVLNHDSASKHFNSGIVVFIISWLQT